VKDKTLIIEASNIHLGGGYVLLQQLLAQLEGIDQRSIVFLDSRLKEKISSSLNIEVNFIEPRLISRLKHYVSLPRILKVNDTLFCFGNIPPFGKPRCYRSFVFLQNWFLVCKLREIKADNWGVYIRLLFERALLRIFSKNIDFLIVQTDSMKRQLQNSFTNLDILVQPFFSMPKVIKSESADFYFYPARGDDSKNHCNLVKAWVHLSKQEFRPQLIITVDPRVNSELVAWIEKMKLKFELDIKNIGFVNTCEIVNMYSKSPIIIFPSYFESFGLPLVEANTLDLDIVASELDYVRDVCRPKETFDPNSHTSIARAVLRHRNLDSELKCGSAIDIINTLINEGIPSNEK